MAALSLVLFLVAMALGGWNLALGMRRGRPAVVPGAIHATVAVTALATLGWRVFTGPENLLLNSSFFVFLLALAGGLATLAVRRRDEPPVLPFIFLHATAAVVAVLLLIGGINAGG